MNLNDIFGDFPQRPDHPDFWRLSETVLKLDGRMEAASTQQQKDAVWSDALGRFIDEDSATYTALQRASRMFNILTRADLKRHAQEVLRPTVAWLEGFIVGSELTSSLGDSALNDLDETALRFLLSTYEGHVQDSHENGTKPLTVAEFYDTFND